MDVFLVLPGETSSGRSVVLLGVGRNRIWRLAGRLRMVIDGQHAAIFCAQTWTAMLSTTALAGRLALPYAQMECLGDESGSPGSLKEVADFVRQQEKNGVQSLILVTHAGLLSHFPAYYVTEVLGQPLTGLPPDVPPGRALRIGAGGEFSLV